MEDFPYKPGQSPQEREIAALRQELAREKARNARKQPAKRKTTRSQKVSTPKPKKSLPPVRLLGEEQPRDHLGRFARKTGAVLWGATKATGRAIKGTAKAMKRAHKTVKRADIRRRARLAMRELKLKERERKAGMKRKKVRRRR